MGVEVVMGGGGGEEWGVEVVMGGCGGGDGWVWRW